MTKNQGQREKLRNYFDLIAEQAKQAQRLNPRDDNLLDLIDRMDNDLQAVITLVNSLREMEG